MVNEQFSDRIIIFHHLTTDELDESIRENKYNAILKDQYQQFVDFCELVINDDTVKDISCRFDSDKERLDFDITYK